MERIAPGSGKKTIKENQARMRVLFQHGRDPQIGDKPLGPIASLRESPTGIPYEVPLLDTSYNRELVPGLKAGLYGSSFRFEVLQESIVQKPERSKTNPEGLPERTITEFRLSEFGPVTFPAYEGATAGIRSLTDRFHTNGTIERDENLEALDSTEPDPESTSPDESRTALEQGKPSRTEANKKTGLDLYPKREEAPPWRL